VLSYPYTTPEAKRLPIPSRFRDGEGRPPMVQRSGRFKTTHTGWYLSAKAYGEVRRFETTLYRALFRGQSKKRYLHALFSSEFLKRPRPLQCPLCGMAYSRNLLLLQMGNPQYISRLRRCRNMATNLPANTCYPRYQLCVAFS
jgi:hypothetical protein